ncbi:cell division protein PerM [Corynebacterium mycetoides]|nr:DUF6350 family protein [Corynebacterium mycetoides]
MSTKSSPHTTPPRTTPSARRRRRSMPQAAAQTRTAPAPHAPETWGERLRHYLPFAAAPSVVAALSVVALSLALVLLTGSPLAYLPAAIGETWLVAHGVPVTFDGVTLGLTPLLPPAAVAALVAQRVRVATRKRVSILDLAAITALGLGIPLTLTCIALFMVADASAVYPVAPPNAFAALALTLGVHAAGIVAGIGPVVWRALAGRAGAPAFVVDTARTAATALLHLVGAAAVVYLCLLLAGWGRVSSLVDAYPTLPGPGLAALIALTLLYLPNAAVATLSALMGGSVEYAGAQASLFSVDNVALPPLPLFAAIPAAAPAWAPVLMLVPAAALVRFFASRALGPRDVALTAAWSGVWTLAVIPFAGGSAGAYGYVGAHVVATPALALAWVAAVGGLVWLIASMRHAKPEPEPEREPEREPEPEPEEEKPAGGSTKWVPPTTEDDVRD